MQQAPALPIKVFWQPGCSSCLRTKEFLQKNGVVFESVNVAADPSGLAELRALGARSVPIVSRGTEYTLCQSMGDVVKFLGLDTVLGDALPPAQLYGKLDHVLHTAIRLTRQLAMMLESHGIVPDRPLTAADLAGLPVPDDVWG